MNKRNTIAALTMAAVLLYGCHDDVYINTNGGNGGSGNNTTDVTLTLSPINFTSADEEADTRTLAYDFVYGNATTRASITAAWDTLNSVGIFPIAPDTNSQVKYTFHSERVADNRTTYHGQGWNLKSDNDYASYYPYQDFVNTKSSKDIPMSFHDQKQVCNGNSQHLDSINNIYYAKAHRPEGNNSITFDYKRAAGIIWVRIIAPDMDYDTGRLTIASYDGKKIFTDSATVNIATGEITRIKTSDRTVLHFDSLYTRTFEKNGFKYNYIQEGDTLNLFLTMAPLGKTREETRVGTLVFELRSLTKTYYSQWDNACTPLPDEGTWYTIRPSSARRIHVDMGLPSGTQWADANLGALLPTDPGYYFAWGASYPSSEYFWNSYAYNITIDDIYELLKDDKFDFSHFNATGANLQKYTIPDKLYFGKWYDNTHQFIGDNKKELEPENDAAVQQLGSYNLGYWDTPTKEQYQELLDNSTLTWQTDYNGSGANGYLCKSNINGNTIFFPAAGYMGRENEMDDVSGQLTYLDNDSVWVQENARGYNANGLYWTRNLSDHYSTDAYQFAFITYPVDNGSDPVYTATPVPCLSTTKRYLGQSIRPVFHPTKQ